MIHAAPRIDDQGGFAGKSGTEATADPARVHDLTDPALHAIARGAQMNAQPNPKRRQKKGNFIPSNPEHS